MILGIVSNVWQNQLEHTDLSDLIGETRQRGLLAVELRQWSLGDYEIGSESEGREKWRPKTDALAELVRRFPDVTFNLAIEWPFLTQRTDPQSPRFVASIEAAKAVGGSSPMLRLVDRTPVDQPLTDESAPAPDQPISTRPSEGLRSAANSVADLARACIAQGVRLSVENSSQSISLIQTLIEKARGHLEPSAKCDLGLCVDPANHLLSSLAEDDSLEALDALPLDQIMLVHFKQARNGRRTDAVSSGDIDYERFLRILTAKSYSGSALFEIPPHDNILEHLEISRRYIEQLM